ncbi:hypothetical protein GCM10009639_26500 [Kitasatospora putterlickiae]|uniref:Uncharacterized protein n=1 Tax=Kitasatospora putterlickiae TaxID=221725 RepID=A0ABP4ILV5_9ACTN
MTTRITDSDLVQAALYGGLTLVLDVWLLARVGYDGRVVAALAALVAVGALVGVGLGRASARRGARARRTGPPVPQGGLRVLRSALTGGLYIHLALPAAALVDVVLRPEHLIGYLGGVF